MAVAGFALAGLGLSNLFPVLISSAARLPGIAPSAGVAMVATLAYAGGLIGPVLIGFGAEIVGLRAALAALILVGVAIGLAAALGAIGRAPAPAETPLPS